MALDVARILLSPLDRLAKTDITDQAIQTLSRSRVKRVRVVGRRGPLQAPYTIKEVRELLHLPDVSFPGIDESLFLTQNVKKLPRQLMRIAQLLQKGSPVEKAQAKKEWELKFMLSPESFLPSSADQSTLGAVRFDEMQFTADANTVDTTDLNALRSLRVQKKTDGKSVVLDTGLAFRSVGYKSTALEGFEDLGIPFDDKMGIIPNDVHGRVMNTDLGPGGMSAGHVSGMYCAGWVKRGPTGVIASTMDDAFNSAEVIAKDWADRVPFLRIGEKEDNKRGWQAVKLEAKKRNIRSVSWEDWQIIDREEKRRGSEKGKERAKCTSVKEMLEILDG